MSAALLDPAPTETTEFDPFDPPPPDEADERARLVRALQLTDRFALFVATCNRADVRQEIVAQIKAENPDLRLVEITVDRGVPNLLAFLSTLPEVKNADGVFVSGLESFLPNTEEVAHSSFVVNLNGTRDAFPKTLSCPLVLWLADYARNGLMQGAPDFYSVRSASFVFSAPLPDVLRIEKLVQDSGYSSAWRLSFQERESHIVELRDLLTQLQSLPDTEQDRTTIYTVANSLSCLYLTCGRYSDAELIMRHLLAESKDLFGQNDLSAVAILANMASLYLDLDQPLKAEKLIKEGLAHYATSTLQPVELAPLNDKLAVAYQNQSKLSEAEQLLKEVLVEKERHFGVDSVYLADTLNNLASIYSDQDRFTDALPLLVRSLNLNKSRWGILHAATLAALGNLGALYYNQGNAAEAEKFLAETLTLRTLALGPEHPDVAISLNNIAFLCQSQGRLLDALDFFKRAESIFDKAFGAEHDHTKAARQNILNLTQLMKAKQAFQPLQLKTNKKSKPSGKKV